MSALEKQTPERAKCTAWGTVAGVYCSLEKGHDGPHQEEPRLSSVQFPVTWKKPNIHPKMIEAFGPEPPAVEQAEPVAYPDDITTRWLEYISSVKHTARAKGEKSPIHHLTSVESILQWWEEDIRPTLFTHPPASDERLREALHKKLDRVLGFFNRHDPEEHRYVTEGGARAIVVGVLAALTTQEPKTLTDQLPGFPHVSKDDARALLMEYQDFYGQREEEYAVISVDQFFDERKP